MRREEMLEQLREIGPHARYPIWIISYNRAGEAPMLNIIRNQFTKQDDVNIVVRKSQALEYERAYPKMNIWDFPDGTIDCVGKARWMAAEFAYSYGHDIITMMDDDVLKLMFLYQREFGKGKNVGVECSGHSGKIDEEELPGLQEHLLSGMAHVAREVFDEYPLAMMGGPIKLHMSFSHLNHRTKYVLNGGVTPRQAMIWNLERMWDNDVALNLDRFGVHGDDIGIVAEVLKAGGDCFAMPSFGYDHWAESINIHKSVVRDGSSKKSLHEFEWESLQQYPIRDYLRVKRSIVDGSYEWGDVNWQKLGKLRGRPPVRVPWDPTVDINRPPESLI